jgi:type II secretory pathway predicted ATPase ExeA
MIDRLQSHYGFTRPPFSKLLTPAQLHQHAGHSQAVARLTWCISARAIGLLVGESGAGKTVAARATIAALDPTRHTLIYLANPTTGARGICHHVVTSLGGAPRFQNAALYPQAADALAAENAERGRLPVLVIDEGHLLDHSQLELVRMLTNAEMDAASPLAVLLVGQPTLKRMMKLGVLAALDQRIAVRYTLTGMTSAETASYINHHVKLAGRTETLFSDDAVALIHQTSRGYPRVVNNLAVSALLAALTANKTIVDESSARTALAELTTTD